MSKVYDPYEMHAATFYKDLGFTNLTRLASSPGSTQDYTRARAA